MRMMADVKRRWAAFVCAIPSSRGPDKLAGESEHQNDEQKANQNGNG